MAEIENYSLEVLELIGKVLKDKDLQKRVYLELQKRNSGSDCLIPYRYKSDRFPDFKDEYSNLYKQVLSKIDAFELEFLWRRGFFTCKNNLKGAFYPGEYGISMSDFKSESNSIQSLVNIFDESSDLKNFYEGTYNTLNYVVNGVYKAVNSFNGEVSDKNELFKDFPIRALVVQEHFVDIVEYLWQVREVVPDAKLCICNHGLAKNRGKTSKTITPDQKMLIQAIAFGCTLEELEEKNYEGAKRLIYVPYQKLD